MEQAGRRLLVAGLVLRQRRSPRLPGVTPDAWINQQYANDRQDGRPRVRVLARVRLAAGRRLQRPDRRADRAVGRQAHHACTSPATPPPPGRRWSWRSATRRASPPRPACRPSATTSAASTHDGTQTSRRRAGPHQAARRPVRALGAVRHVPADRPPAQQPQRPAARGSTATAANESAEKFLNLREKLRALHLHARARRPTAPACRSSAPRTWSTRTRRAPTTPPAASTSTARTCLVAPVTTPGTTATTSVWFPPGRWTDYFTGKTYSGGTTAVHHDRRSTRCRCSSRRAGSWPRAARTSPTTCRTR